MKFQVGPFTCALSRDDNGKVQVAWQPEPPRYLNSAERRQHRAGHAAFDLAERLRKLDEPPPQSGAPPLAPTAPLRLSTAVSAACEASFAAWPLRLMPWWCALWCCVAHRRHHRTRIVGPFSLRVPVPAMRARVGSRLEGEAIMRLAYKAACLCGFHNWWDAGGGKRVCLECGEQERSEIICLDAGRCELIKPKVMYVISEDWFFCSHFLERALAARDAGYDVVVMTRERAHGQKIRAAGIRLLPVNFDRRSINPVKELASLLRIYLAYRRERPDVLHHVAAKAIFYGSLAALPFRHKLAIVNAPVGMGYVFSSGERLARLLRPFFCLGYRLLLNPRRSRVIFENPDDAADFVKDGIARATDVVVIRGAGVDVRKFRPVNAPAGPPVVALVARMLRDKGVYEFVEAAHRLHEAGVAARFVLVGYPDPENPASIPLEQLRSWHGQKGVEWWGWREDMVSTWHQVHVACLPSFYREGLPKALLEAAACGLPIVTTDAIGCREAVRDGENGLLVPVRDTPALANALRILIADADLRARMGKQSRARAEREFASERVTSETLAVYRLLAATATSEKQRRRRVGTLLAPAVVLQGDANHEA